MAASKPSYFFSSSQSVDNHLGKTFSFIWASYTGLRELWWQVRGFKTNFPNLHISDIEKKFLSGLALPGGIDLNQLCVETDWSSHEEEFAKWLLFDACTMYEGWLERVCLEVFGTTHANNCSKQLQFPNKFHLAVRRANQSKSTFIKAQFFPTLSTGKFNRWSDIKELLIAYRFFKECRNSFIHSDGKVTNQIITSHANLLSVLRANPSLIRGSLTVPIGSTGERVKMVINDVIQFTRIIKYLITTFDTALCVSTNCELILEQRLRSLTSVNNKWQSLPSDKTKREQRIHRMLGASRIPEPVNITTVDSWMVNKGIIA